MPIQGQVNYFGPDIVSHLTRNKTDGFAIHKYKKQGEKTSAMRMMPESAVLMNTNSP